MFFSILDNAFPGEIIEFRKKQHCDLSMLFNILHFRFSSEEVDMMAIPPFFMCRSVIDLPCDTRYKTIALKTAKKLKICRVAIRLTLPIFSIYILRPWFFNFLPFKTERNFHRLLSSYTSKEFSTNEH